MAQIDRLIRIVGTIVPTFFCLEKPISRNMKPACMNRTSTAATMTQVDSTAGITSLSVVAAAMAQVSNSCGNQSFAPRTGFAAGALYGRLRAQPVLDEFVQVLGAIGGLDLLLGDGRQCRMERGLAVEDDGLPRLHERVAARRDQ